MALQLGDTAPDFEADTTEGRISFHDWIGDSWAVLFSHPRDFTPVCTTELGYMAKIKPDFESRNVKIIGLSIDPLDNHEKWAQDIEETQGTALNYPIIGDPEFEVAKAYGMLPADVSGDPTARTPAQNQTVRNVFVIGPDKKIKLILVYPMTTGRNFDEVLRVIDSLQLTAEHKVSTPVNWQQGEDVIIAGSVTDEQAREMWPEGWESPRPYIRIVPQPAKTLRRPSALASVEGMRIAVIGAGPAGFYASDQLLEAGFEVDLLDALPTPFGLVRSGVAPDHPNIKAVTRVYEKTAAKPGFRFFGGVVLGEHVSRADLLERYHAVVYAFGTDDDNRLGIPGEDRPRCYSARRFVAWYNGHPDAVEESFDLSPERAVVIGNGNVATDVARMLLLDPDELGSTDVADHALGPLAEAQVQEVILLGRRGPGPGRLHQPGAARAGGDDRRRRAGRPGGGRHRRSRRTSTRSRAATSRSCRPTRSARPAAPDAGSR